MTSTYDENRISFIICINDDLYADECESYIRSLEVPEGYTVDVLMVRDALSMASGYNEAMLASDAKYKVYVHQDVLIYNRKFIRDILEVFESDKDIGVIGVVGNTVLSEDAIPWDTGSERIGGVYSDYVSGCSDELLGEPKNPCKDVVVVDGLLMATQYDIKWREDIFDGWHFYDQSQSMEFHRAGYRVVVPHMEKPWCFHDNDFHILKDDYHLYRKRFLEEYEYERSAPFAEYNIRCMRERFPELYERFETWLSLSDGIGNQSVPEYNRIGIAEAWLANQPDPCVSNILVFGFGEGHEVRAILSKKPEKSRVLIYEPSTINFCRQIEKGNLGVCFEKGIRLVVDGVNEDLFPAIMEEMLDFDSFRDYQVYVIPGAAETFPKEAAPAASAWPPSGALRKRGWDGWSPGALRRGIGYMIP